METPIENHRQSVTVFASSSNESPLIYKQIAYELGRAFALHGHRAYYGGGDCGLMKSFADGALIEDGSITGVIPTILMSHVDKRLSTNNVKRQLIECADIEERKVILTQPEVIIALPGGVGTFDEIYMAAGLDNKTVILFNYDNYYQSMLRQHRDIHFVVAESISQVMFLLQNDLRKASIVQKNNLSLAVYDGMQFVKETIDAKPDFVCFADKTDTFLAVMKKDQYVNFRERGCLPADEVKNIFELCTSVILFSHDVPLTYEIMHKMIMYNQLGLHGKHEDGRQIHKPIVLFDPEGLKFFSPTREQLDTACTKKMLSSVHFSGLTKGNHENIAEVATNLFLEDEEFSLWEKAESKEPTYYKQSIFIKDKTISERQTDALDLVLEGSSPS